MKIKTIIPVIISIICYFNFGSYNQQIRAQQANSIENISPIFGKLMLVGEKHISKRTAATFAYLADEDDGKLLILQQKGAKELPVYQYWQEHLAAVKIITLDKSLNSISDKDINAIHEATAIWLANDFSLFHFHDQLIEELKKVLRKDGLIGAQGTAAESMATLIYEKNQFRDGLNLLPNSYISAKEKEDKAFIKTTNLIPGTVGWEIPANASVVIHDSREIAVIDDTDIRLRTAAYGDWPERVETFGPPIDHLAFTADLISWNRSAIARKGELFPPTVAPTPEVVNGALLIIGGHGYPNGMWERVIEYAGGRDANYVCFAQSASSTGAEKLRNQGCKNVAVHVVKTGVDGIGLADDPQLLEDLKNANAIYFGGGRTYKFMDAFLNTEAHQLMNEVLERGGIILGGSAGAQIQGDFLVRGDPRTNNTLWMEGNEVGLSFIKGVIIDVHYRERGRENIFPKLLVNYPQMLGIAIDETTAIWVEGTTAEVLGPHSVTFYDLKNKKNLDLSSEEIKNADVLMKGEKYDLKLRQPID